MSTPPQALSLHRIDAVIYRLDGICDQAAANLLATFTGFVLIPISIGATSMEVRSQPVPLLAEAMSPEHRQRLSVSSIAVALGINGLATILFPQRDHLLDFLRKNPTLVGTLITAHSGAFIVWIVADLPHRQPLCTSRFSIMTEGKVMVFNRAATAQPSYFLTVATPMKVDLESLNWGADPDGQVAAWSVSVRRGEFFRRERRGVLKPNLAAWTDFLARRLKSVMHCNPGNCHFEERDGETGDWKTVGIAAVVARVSDMIRTAPIGPELSKANIGEKWILSTVLPGLRAALYADPPAIDHFVALFMQEVMVPQKRSNLTLGELYSAFERLRVVRRWPAFSNWDLGKSFRRLMAGSPHLKRVSKSIVRENGNNDGYRGFALHLPVDALPIDSKVGVAA